MQNLPKRKHLAGQKPRNWNLLTLGAPITKNLKVRVSAKRQKYGTVHMKNTQKPGIIVIELFPKSRKEFKILDTNSRT